MKLDDIGQGFNTLWDSVAEGWQRLCRSAAGALIRLLPGEGAYLPGKAEVDDAFCLPSHG